MRFRTPGRYNRTRISGVSMMTVQCVLHGLFLHVSKKRTLSVLLFPRVRVLHAQACSALLILRAHEQINSSLHSRPASGLWCDVMAHAACLCTSREIRCCMMPRDYWGSQDAWSRCCRDTLVRHG